MATLSLLYELTCTCWKRSRMMTAVYLPRSLLFNLWYADESNHTACLGMDTALKSYTLL